MGTAKGDRWDAATWGLVMIGFGALMLLRTTGFEVGEFWSWWPFVLLALGAVRFATADVYGKRRGGLVMMFVGLWGWVNTSGLWGLEWSNSWPLLLIGFGALTVFESLFRPKENGKENDHA